MWAAKTISAACYRYVTRAENAMDKYVIESRNESCYAVQLHFYRKALEHITSRCIHVDSSPGPRWFIFNVRPLRSVPWFYILLPFRLNGNVLTDEYVALAALFADAVYAVSKEKLDCLRKGARDLLQKYRVTWLVIVLDLLALTLTDNSLLECV